MHHALSSKSPAWMGHKDDSPEIEPFIEKESLDTRYEPSKWQRVFQLDSLVVWQMLSAFFAFTSLLLSVGVLRHSSGGFEHGFSTDAHDAKSALKIQQVTFQGGASWYDNGTEYMRPTIGKQYAGEPSQEIDDNWTELTQGRWFRLTEDEARLAWGAEYRDFWNEFGGGYVATIDAMHMLHCLDHIRKSFHPEYYRMEHTGIHGNLHRDHCIDSLRQALMCNADITPLPTRWYPNVHLGTQRTLHYVDSDRPHTCRDWNAVRDWVTDRAEGPNMVGPKHSKEHEEDYLEF